MNIQTLKIAYALSELGGPNTFLIYCSGKKPMLSTWLVHLPVNVVKDGIQILPCKLMINIIQDQSLNPASNEISRCAQKKVVK